MSRSFRNHQYPCIQVHVLRGAYLWENLGRDHMYDHDLIQSYADGAFLVNNSALYGQPHPRDGIHFVDLLVHFAIDIMRSSRW